MATTIKFKTNTALVKEYLLNPNQDKFILCPKRFIAYVGGRGCGKSLGLVLKIIQLMLKYNNNYGLVGRFNYSDLRDTTEKDFFDICPRVYIKSHLKQEHKVTFINGSTVIFRGLKDIKKTEVRSLNLGFFALEQAEEINETLFDELSASLRRHLVDADGVIGKQQGFILANPALNWIFKRFKQRPMPDSALVPGSMLDNAINLPDAFVKDMLSKPEEWQRVFVYGEFDENLLAGRAVFPIEYIKQMAATIKKPIRKEGDWEIFKEVEEGHSYQMGVDPTEGANDFCSVKCININTGEEVAAYHTRIQPDLLAFEVDKLGRIYNNARVVLEINGIGLATLTKLKDFDYPNIYVREEYDRRAKIMTTKLGWRTTYASKPLLVGNFLELLGKKFVKLRDQTTLDEAKTFVYSEGANSRGMSGEKGFYDDSIMGTMLAYWDVRAEARTGDDKVIIRPEEQVRKTQDRLFLKDILTGVPPAKHWLE